MTLFPRKILTEKPLTPMIDETEVSPSLKEVSMDKIVNP